MQGRASSVLVCGWYRLRAVTNVSNQPDRHTAGRGALTIASSFFRSSSPELRNMTCCNSRHASPYASIAPSKFCALSSNTAVLAFCSARDSIVFLSFSPRSLFRDDALLPSSSDAVVVPLTLLSLVLLLARSRVGARRSFPSALADLCCCSTDGARDRDDTEAEAECGALAARPLALSRTGGEARADLAKPLAGGCFLVRGEVAVGTYGLWLK